MIIISEERSELIKKIRWMNKIRKTVNALFFLATLAGFMVMNIFDLEQVLFFKKENMIALFIVEAIEFIINTPYKFIIEKINNLYLFGLFQASLDMLVISFFTYYMGGIDFPQGIAIYVFGITFISLILQRKSGYWLALESSFLYAFLVIGQLAGIIPSNRTTSCRFSSSEQLFMVVLTMAIFFLMAYFGEDVMKMFTDKDRAQNKLKASLDELADRTSELQAAYDEMHVMNENLIETRNELWGEMKLAKKIQTVLLPVSPEVPGYELTAFMKPANEVGGDYYDVINCSSRDWIAIGDVSGHGVPAGLVMMMVQSVIQAKISENPDISPSALLSFAGKAVSSNINKLEESRFVSIVAFALLPDGEILYSGRHDRPLVYRHEERKVESLSTSGNIFSSLPQRKNIADEMFTLTPGDVLFLYTDGITEAQDVNGNMFSEEKLREVLCECGELHTEEIRDRVLEELNEYRVGDDVTMVILKKLTV